MFGLKHTRATTISAKPAIESMEARLVLDASSFVTGLYHDVLRRDPSPQEVQTWDDALASGTTRKTIAAAFWESSEHRALQVDDAL